MDVSARTTYFSLTDTNTVQIASGEPVTVHQIFVCNRASGAANNREINIRTADGSDETIIYVEVDTGGFFVLDTPFIADKGIEFVSVTDNSAAIDITVWHSNPGL